MPSDSDAEKSVQFINKEVLNPPEQGKISFVGPYVAQSLAMALEDARSFVQGAEQILLVALAKYLATAVGSADGVAASPPPDLSGIQNLLTGLAEFHSKVAATALQGHAAAPPKGGNNDNTNI